jgi:hypothetical protein
MANVGKCPECKATVFWFKTVKGGTVALNPLPARFAVLIPGEDGEPAVEVRSARTVHFDTCKKKPASRRTRS